MPLLSRPSSTASSTSTPAFKGQVVKEGAQVESSVLDLLREVVWCS